MLQRNTMQTGHAAQASRDTGKKIRKFVLRVAIILVAGFIIVHFIKAHHQSNVEKTTDEAASSAPLVNVITVADAPGTEVLKLPGETAAWYESIIYARVDGYVGNWTADIGDKVKKGQVLATIETPDLDAQLAATKALILSRKAAADFAKTTYDRWRGSPKGVVSEQEREAKKEAFDSAVAQLSQAQADVDRYTVLAKFKQVVAPFDGTITERRIDIGNLVTAGSNTSTTSLYKMSQDDPMRVFVDVPQSAAGDMKVGVDAKITTSTIADKVFEGKIARTADAIDPQARTLRVEVDLPNPKQELVPGTYVDIAFDIPMQGLVQVPAAALVFRSSGQPEAAVISEDGKVNFRKVTIARDNGNTVEISSGIKAGDKVALNISNQIVEGEKVKPNDSSEGKKDEAVTEK